MKLDMLKKVIEEQPEKVEAMLQMLDGVNYQDDDGEAYFELKRASAVLEMLSEAVLRGSIELEPEEYGTDKALYMINVDYEKDWWMPIESVDQDWYIKVQQ